MINQDNERRERLLDQDQIDEVRKREVVPGRNATRSELRELAQLASPSFGHPIGTCRIGTDNMESFDPELRMHSIKPQGRRLLGHAVRAGRRDQRCCALDRREGRYLLQA